VVALAPHRVPLAPRAALRYDVVRREVDWLRPASLLEIGCGLGGFGARLAASGIDYLGVEQDEASCAVAERRVTAAGGRVVCGSYADVVPAGAEFDVVCAFEVLEHIEDDASALHDWRALVRPGGHLLLSVPAWQDMFGGSDILAGHYRRYSPDGLRARLLDASFVQPRITVYGWPLGYALEAVRNRLAARRLGEAGGADEAATCDARTAGSGRLMQPNAVAGLVVRAGVAPFSWLQRTAPGRGTGLVVTAQRPAT